jgi:asparagine synthase (glutamine-hydrolysing)
MCGICGIAVLGNGSIEEHHRPQLDTMVRALRHRGPDGLGTAADERAIFGVARLAIRGLADGEQPMIDPQSGVMAVCNGEIDNHAELRTWLNQRGRPVRQATDVAVIPGLYLELGEFFVERLVGAFAIALWDPRVRLLILARDRAGERPLFYWQTDRTVVFASELSGLLPAVAHPPQLEEGGLRFFLQFGYFGHHHTPFSEVRRVGPAEILSIDARGVSQRRYWRWSPATGSRAEQPSIAEFDRILREAVRRQSEVDVEHGLFLSGGVDSSLIAAVARSLRPRAALKAFTLRFDEKSYDEGHYALKIAESLGLQSIAVPVRPESFPEALSDLIRHCGEPLADPAWIPTMLLARRAAQDIRLALVGEGCDELFGGYPTYIGAVAAEHYTKIPLPLRNLIKRLIDSWPVSDKKVTLSFLLKRFVEAAELDGMTRHLVWTSNIPPAILHRLGLPSPIGEEQEIMTGVLNRIQQYDLETSLAEGLLTKADRASMRWGVELRAPFLDVAVMDYAARLPAAARTSGLSTKTFLKHYALRYLPKSVVYRRKRGLSVPLSSWLRGPLYGWAKAKLSSSLLADTGVNLTAAAELLQEHCARRADHARALWTLIVLSEWLTWFAQPKIMRSCNPEATVSRCEPEVPLSPFTSSLPTDCSRR